MKHSVTIYYDPDCGFCLSACRKITKYLFLSEAEIKVVTSDKLAHEIFMREYSWVVFEHHSGKYYSKSTAWWRLVRASRFSLFYYISQMPGVMWFGDRVYDFVVKHRPKTCKV